MIPRCLPCFASNTQNIKQIWYQNVPYSLSKKINNHALCFFFILRNFKLQAFEILKQAGEVNRASRGNPDKIRHSEILIDLFTCENITFIH